MHGKYLLELFSGSAKLSAALKRLGIPVYAFDSKYGKWCDLLNPDALNNLYGRIAGGHCIGVWFGMPCETVSRARRGGNGAGPLRGEDKKTRWNINHVRMNSIN